MIQWMKKKKSRTIFAFQFTCHQLNSTRKPIFVEVWFLVRPFCCWNIAIHFKYSIIFKVNTFCPTLLMQALCCYNDIVVIELWSVKHTTFQFTLNYFLLDNLSDYKANANFDLLSLQYNELFLPSLATPMR